MNQARIRIFILMLTDVLSFFGILLMMAYAHIYTGINEEGMLIYFRLWPISLVLIAFFVLGHLYHGNPFYPGAALGPVNEMRNIFVAVVLTYFTAFAWIFLSRNAAVGYSRLILGSSCFLSVILLPLSRIVVCRIMKALNIGQIPLLIAGAGQGGQRLAHELQYDAHCGFQVVGFLDDNLKKTVHPSLKLKILGTLADAGSVAKRNDCDYIICAIPITIMRDTVNGYFDYFQHVAIIPDSHIMPISWSFPINLLNSYATLEISNQLRLGLPRIWKRLFESVLSIFATLLMIPVLILLAILVKLTSRGPVFYLAKRISFDGKAFRVLKFRTMYEHADRQLRILLEENPELAREWNEKYKLDHDPRVTPFGRFLRKTSLDELPQLINVLRGDMSLIGPRPIVRDELKYYEGYEEILSRVKPGITGLWQVSGRSNLDYEARVRLDINYVLNWSVWLDFYILLRTFIEVTVGRGAK